MLTRWKKEDLREEKKRRGRRPPSLGADSGFITGWPIRDFDSKARVQDTNLGGGKSQRIILRNKSRKPFARQGNPRRGRGDHNRGVNGGCKKDCSWMGEEGIQRSGDSLPKKGGS